MWFAKNGPRPHSQSGPGVPVSKDEARAIVGLHEAKYVGAAPPSINADQPSPDVRNVVLEVETAADTSDALPKVGFYFILGLNPHDAQLALSAIRG